MPLTSLVDLSRFFAVALVATACTAAPDPAAFVTLAGTTRVVAAPLVLRPSSPMSAKDEENMVCLALSAGDTLRDDWTIAASGNRSVQLHAELTLVNGDTVPLPTQSMLGAKHYCLGPERFGPLADSVREARVWSSAPITVEGIEWISTHK